MHTYPILRVLSVGKKSIQITVKVDGKTVTRHIVHGRGKHPNDRIPARHERHQAEVRDARRKVEALDSAIAALKADKDPSIVARRAELQGYIDAKRTAAVLELDAATLRYQELVKNDPLMVDYFTEDDAEVAA